MPTVQHAALTGAELHEPKDIAAASADEVYVADGAAGGAMEAFNNVVAINIGDLKLTTTSTGNVTVDKTVGMPWSGRICAISWQVDAGDVLNTVQDVIIKADTTNLLTNASFPSVIVPTHAIYNSADAEWFSTPADGDYSNATTMLIRLSVTSASANSRTFSVTNVTIYVDIGKKAPYTEVL